MTSPESDLAGHADVVADVFHLGLDDLEALLARELPGVDDIGVLESVLHEPLEERRRQPLGAVLGKLPL